MKAPRTLQADRLLKKQKTAEQIFKLMKLLRTKRYKR